MPDEVKPHRRPVFLTDLNVCVLVHRDTKRILCAAHYDEFAKRMARKTNCQIIQIRTRSDYDIWIRRFCQQHDREQADEDAAYLEREQRTRQLLRKQLRDRLAVEASGDARREIDSALHCLDIMEQRRQRYRSESFVPQEAFEANKNPGEEIIQNLIPKKPS